MARVRWSVPLPGPFNVSGGVGGVSPVKAVVGAWRLGAAMGQHWASFWLLMNLGGMVLLGWEMFFLAGPYGLIGFAILWGAVVTLLTLLFFTLPWAIARGRAKRRQ